MKNKSNFVAPLFEGPLDIIGDVHGEIDVLEKLLSDLGYDANGDSAEGRRLVFLGDLIDRGPDSPAVVDKVIELVKNGKAQCLMGNHELNILLERPLPGNGWLMQPNHFEKTMEFHSKNVDPYKIEQYHEFFSSLPLALENNSLRLAHACWHSPSVSQLRLDMNSGLSIIELFRKYEIESRQKMYSNGLTNKVEQENIKHSVSLYDPEWSASVLPAHAEAEIYSQNINPIRVLTTGPVNIAKQPFFAMGHWRMADRARWWDRYNEDIPVIIGHFWRRFDKDATRISGVFGKDVFEGIESHDWMGNKQNVYCVDYSVGQLHKERQLGTSSQDEFHGKLAALRYPEWEVHHDDGTIIRIV
ncbi:MAG: metallophosphoesterase [Gammaproteobacteria bacterium]|nr:metallophosphoesterase [Gammaproteobacteria bacterium]